MGKKKNNADKVRNRTSASKEKKLNPFEFKINRQKHFVVGRNNHNTGQVGKPGQSRSKANKRVSIFHYSWLASIDGEWESKQ